MKTILSVIIPFFNRMAYIAQLVESVPLRDDIEIIIVDDKSKAEETAQLVAYVRAAQETRNIQYFYNEGTKSAGACRNVGLQHAVGEWVLFADSDDYFMPNLYETIAPWFTKEADLIFFTPTSIDRVTGEEADRHKGGENLIRNYLENPCDETRYRLKTFFSEPWSKLFRASVLREHDIFFDEVLAWNDLMFSVKAAFATENIAVSEEKIYCVTKSPGSLVYSVDKAVLDARLGSFIRHYKFIKTKVPKEIFKKFDLNGRSRLIQYITQKQNPLVVFGALGKMIQNGIPLFSLRLLNPAVLVRAIKGRVNENRQNRGYYKKMQDTNK